jgi:acid phosphatase (class A)
VRPNRILFVLSLLVPFLLGACRAEPRILEPTAVDVTALLPPPPAPGSAEAVADTDAVLRAQGARTEADVARAKSEAKLTPAAFQSVLGAAFTAQKYPSVYGLLKDAERDSKYFASKAKDYFARPRPKDADSRVRPVIVIRHNFAYPSGHATRGTLWATILSEIVPGKKKELAARGQEIGWDRVVAGVHYPSDVHAGEVLGQTLARAMLKSPDFRERLQMAKQEYDTQNSAALMHSSAN